MPEYEIKSKKGFYIGDPCYVLSDKVYYDIWENTGYDNGKIDCGKFSFMVHSTAEGDGLYELFTEKGILELPVDSGSLSIIPLELINEEKMEQAVRLGHIQKGKKADLNYEEGIFNITIDNMKFEINTLSLEEEKIR